LFIYREAEFVYHYLLGNWADEYLIENELVEQNLRYGQVWDVSNYLGLECDRRLRHGDFAGARRILARLADINDAYGYAFAGVTRDGRLGGPRVRRSASSPRLPRSGRRRTGWWGACRGCSGTGVARSRGGRRASPRASVCVPGRSSPGRTSRWVSGSRGADASRASTG